MLDRNGIYSINDILNTKADYNLILSTKSTGKTSKVLEWVLRQCAASGFTDTFAYVRRWSTDVTRALASTYFDNVKKYNDLKSITGYDELVYDGGRFYNARKKDGKPIPEGSPVGYVFTLSATEHISSAAFPSIKYIVFDEFVSVRSNLPNEFLTFTVLVSNIVRLRNDVKIFMLGNLHSRHDLYFREMGLKKIKTQKSGTIDVYKVDRPDLFDGTLTIAVEICGESRAKRKSNKYFAFENAKLSTVVSDKWTMDLYPHLPKHLKFRPSDVIASCLFLCEEQTYQGELIVKEGQRYVNVHPRTAEWAYDDDYTIYASNVVPYINGRRGLWDARNRVDEAVRECYERGLFFYSDNETGDDVTHLIDRLSNM